MAVQRIITLLTIKTVSRVTEEMTRLMLTVQGCCRMSEIRMIVVELWENPQVLGNIFA